MTLPQIYDRIIELVANLNSSQSKNDAFISNENELASLEQLREVMEESS